MSLQSTVERSGDEEHVAGERGADDLGRGIGRGGVVTQSGHERTAPRHRG